MRTLGRRALNRATLERQMLLSRKGIPVIEAIERQIGLNAQDPVPPAQALWARLSGFDPEELTRLTRDRIVVRSVMMRGTQHLVSARDFLAFRPLLRPLLARIQRGTFGRATDGVDLAELAELTRKLLAEQPLTRPELGRRLAQRWPDHEPRALGWSAQYLVPVVHPPSGRGPTPFALGESWLDSPLETDPSPEPMIRRYLAAFGPAAVRDISAWTGIARLREPVERMDLRTFRDEHGRVLYDLPDAPLPDPDTPAPARLLPWFDNLVLAHADRTRVMSDEYRKVICVGDAIKPTVLVDGDVAGTWSINGGVLTIEPFVRLPARHRADVAEEGARLLAFALPDTPHDIRFVD